MNNPGAPERLLNRLSQKQATAIAMIERVGDIIITTKSEVLETIKSSRLSGKAYKAIAIEHAAALFALGATTDTVQKNVVAYVCAKVLSIQENHQASYRCLLQRQSRPVTEQCRLRSNEVCRLINWTPEIDAELFRCTEATRCAESSGSNKGKIDWRATAEKMNKLFAVNLSPKQWMARRVRLRSRPQVEAK